MSTKPTAISVMAGILSRPGGLDRASALKLARASFPVCQSSGRGAKALAESFAERLRTATAKGVDPLRARASIGAKHAAEFRAWIDVKNSAPETPPVPDQAVAATEFDRLVSQKMNRIISMGQVPDRRQVQQQIAAAAPALHQAWCKVHSGASIPNSRGSRFPAA